MPTNSASGMNAKLPELSSTSFTIIKEGAQGEIVVFIQQLFKDLGYDLAVDGTYGPETRKLILKFQDVNHEYLVGQTGDVDLKTFELLCEFYKNRAISPINCWFLKINGNHWNINQFKIGLKAYFHSHRLSLNGKAQDYENYKRIKKDDPILAYSFGRRKELVGIFTVIRELYNNPIQAKLLSLA
jgi:hypothetical protein